MRIHGAWLVPLVALGWGCAPATPSVPHFPQGTLVLAPSFEAGGFRTQSVISAYASPDVNHLVVQLFLSGAGSESAVLVNGASVSLDLPQASLSVPLVFGNLHAQSTYRVRGYAYKAAGTAAANLISSDSSYVDVALTDDDRPTVGSLLVRLLDKSFAATSSVAISLANGAGAHHVLAALYKVTGGSAVAVSGATASLAVGELPGTFTVGNLAANATYRVLASAQNASNVTLATNSVDVTVSTETSAATKSLVVTIPAS